MEDFVGRGDRRVAPVIEAAWRAGAGMDAWFETIDRTHAAWTEAIEAAGLGGRYRALELGSLNDAASLTPADLADFCARPLPWDHIDSGVDKAWLAEDLGRALAAAVVPDCSFDGCSSCGVCGPELGHNMVVPAPPVPAPQPQRPPPSERLLRLRFGFARRGSLALLSHLDMQRLLERALRRSGLPASYSGGFHPLPRMQLALPLPLGAEGFAEWMDLEFCAPLPPEEVRTRLQDALPPEFRLLSVAPVPVFGPSLSQLLEAAEWQIELRPTSALAAPSRHAWQDAVASLLAADTLLWHDRDKKGRPRQRDCRPYLLDLRTEPGGEGPDVQRLRFRARIDAQGRSLRPEHLQHWLAEILQKPLSLGAMRRLRLILGAC
jgi:radical SAM-linked protein